MTRKATLQQMIQNAVQFKTVQSVPVTTALNVRLATQAYFYLVKINAVRQQTIVDHVI